MDNMNFNNEKGNIQEPDFVIVNDNKNNGSYGYKENHSPYREHNSKGKKSSGKKALSYIAIGLICATLGGAAGAAGTIYVLPKTATFKESPLYKSMSENKNVNYGPTTLATEKDALTVSEIVKKIGPAVVGVTTKSRVSNGFFNQQVQEGIGSGFIINEEGYILTNFHVISGAQEVKVILSDGKEVAAKVINYDQDNDVAVVKITDNVKVPGVAELGDSDSVQVGEGVVAIGNPLGKEFLGTVTNGIVSALNRDIDIENKKLNLIQTNAAINPGNSGGPLVNSRGQVIGINTAKIGAQGVEGIGFSIPINQVKGRLESLSKPILKVGISAREITEEMAKANKVPVGVYILEVQEFSPAEKAGVRPGDIITKFDGEKVKTVGEINQIKGKHKAGDTVKVEIVRDGKTKTLDLTLTE